MNKKVFGFEAYLKSPSGQSNWEIHHINVFANSETHARERLKQYPKFDRVIHYKGELPLTQSDIEVIEHNHNVMFRRVPISEIKEYTFN